MADLPSECDETLNRMSKLLENCNLDAECSILEKQLEKKEEALLRQIRYQLEELNSLSPEFYNSLLENEEVRTAMIDPTSLAEETNDRLHKLMNIEEKLRNAKNEIKDKPTNRFSARQAMRNKRSFKDC